jgi:F-type H+-transporting ATPase subunit gamma
MQSPREMQKRIQTIENIGQLTRALQAVSASQVRTSRVLADNTRAYIVLAWQILADLYHEREFYHKMKIFDSPDLSKPSLIVFISADRGLAGSFPTNIFKTVIDLDRKLNVPVQYITIGKKGRDMLQRRRKKIIADFSELSTVSSFHDLKAMAAIVLEDFEKGLFGQAYIVYTEYESMSKFTPTVKQLLPFSDSVNGEQEISTPFHRGGCIYEGDPDVIMHSLLTRFIRMELFHAITSSKASEHTSRMLAMNQATENSEEILASLNLEFNKIRQLRITNDILDIIGGSSADSQHF